MNQNRYVVICNENGVRYDCCGPYDKDVADEVADWLTANSTDGHEFNIVQLNPLLPPQKSTVGSPLYVHPVYGNIKIVDDPGRPDCLVRVRNFWTGREHAVTRHELSNAKLDEAHAKVIQPSGPCRTPSGFPSSCEFESFIAGSIHRFSRRGIPGGIEGLDKRGVEVAHEWLLSRESDPRCRGIIKRTKHLRTLREIAHYISQGLDARGFYRD